MLVDTDVGIVKFIQFTCQGDEKYHPDLMDKNGASYTKMIQCITYQRIYSNPLSTIMTSEAMIENDPDQLLKDLMDNNKQEIGLLSPNTGLMDMICGSIYVADTLKFTVLCNDQEESDSIRDRLEHRLGSSTFPISIIVDDKCNIDPDIYGNYYIKDIHDLDKYKGPLVEKNLIIGNYRFNKEFNEDGDVYIDLPIMKVIHPYTERNKISFVDIYSQEITSMVKF